MTARVFECAFILVGIVAMIAITTLRNQTVGAAEGTIAFLGVYCTIWGFLPSSRILTDTAEEAAPAATPAVAPA